MGKRKLFMIYNFTYFIFQNDATWQTHFVFIIFLTVRARVDLIVVAAQENFFFHNSPKVVVGHGLKDYGVKNLFTM